MAHEFESGFFVARGAWHGLGTTLQSSPTTQEAIIQAGLDWRVTERLLTPSETDGADTQLRKQLVRDRDQAVLGTVDRDYKPLQNADAFRWFDPLIKKGRMTLEAAGSLQGGKRIWVLARIARTEEKVGLHDLVRSYLLLHNSHDGSTAVWLQFTPIRVVCMNTLAMAASRRFQNLKQKQSACIPHTASLEAQMDKVQRLVDIHRLEFQMSAEDYRAMADLEVDDKLLSTYMGSVLGTTLPQMRPEWPQLVNNFERGQGNRGKTLWDAYNAVTEWIDHQKEKSDERRLWSSWFGTGALLRETAHRAAIALVPTNSASGSAYKRRQQLICEQLRQKLLVQQIQESADFSPLKQLKPLARETTATASERIEPAHRVASSINR